MTEQEQWDKKFVTFLEEKTANGAWWVAKDFDLLSGPYEVLLCHRDFPMALVIRRA